MRTTPSDIGNRAYVNKVALVFTTISSNRSKLISCLNGRWIVRDELLVNDTLVLYGEADENWKMVSMQSS